MSRVPGGVEELTVQVEHVAHLTVAGARARQLLEGCTPKTTGSPKLARLAQAEVTEGKVRKLESETSASSING